MADDHDRMLDDSEVRFALCEINLKPPSTEPETISLAKERELRQLRSKVGQLEDENNRLKGRLTSPLTSIESYEEPTHTIKCGYHPQYLVSMETASVTCAVCGAEIAPLDVLREYAQNERHFVSGINSLREEKTKLFAEVEALKKQASTMRSKVRKKAGYDPAAHKDEIERYSARAYYDLVAENSRLRDQLDARKAGS